MRIYFFIDFLSWFIQIIENDDRNIDADRYKFDQLDGHDFCAPEKGSKAAPELTNIKIEYLKVDWNSTLQYQFGLVHTHHSLIYRTGVIFKK